MAPTQVYQSVRTALQKIFKMAKTAKRKLSNFDFSKDGCHVSLVGKSLGGPANDRQTLLLKSLNPSGETKKPSNGEGNKMTVEMIEKSAVDVMVQKAVEDATKVLKAELDSLKAAEVARVEKARKDKLEAVIGTETLETTFMAIKSLDDASFEVVLKGFEAAKADEAKGKMFTEKGASADGKTTAETDEVKRLADKIAAQFKTN